MYVFLVLLLYIQARYLMTEKSLPKIRIEVGKIN